MVLTRKGMDLADKTYKVKRQRIVWPLAHPVRHMEKVWASSAVEAKDACVFVIAPWVVFLKMLAMVFLNWGIL